jgi:hypothetical protein
MSIMIALQSIRLDKGEGMEYAQASTTRFAAQEQKFWACDIVCRPDQKTEGDILALTLKKLILGASPQLKEENLFIATTTIFDERPAAFMMLRQLIDERIIQPRDLQNIHDINPARKKSWKNT